MLLYQSVSPHFNVQFQERDNFLTNGCFAFALSMDIYLTAIIWRESFYGGEKEIAGDLMAPIKAKTKINNMATGLIVTTEYCIYHQAS